MTNEQLQNGIRMAEEIKYLEKQLERWNEAIRFSNSSISLFDSKCRVEVETKYIDFDVVKALAISKIEKRLKEVKEQFENL